LSASADPKSKHHEVAAKLKRALFTAEGSSEANFFKEPTDASLRFVSLGTAAKALDLNRTKLSLTSQLYSNKIKHPFPLSLYSMAL
jgi:hypothetical protein